MVFQTSIGNTDSVSIQDFFSKRNTNQNRWLAFMSVGYNNTSTGVKEINLGSNSAVTVYCLEYSMGLIKAIIFYVLLDFD